MSFCTNCGKQVADGGKFCTACGTPVTIAATAPVAEPQPPDAPVQTTTSPIQATPAPPIQPTVQPLQYAPPPAATAVYQEEPISTGGYIGILLLMMVPVVNLVCLLIWACGGCRKRSKTNLARAMLVWMLIGAVLGALVFLAGGLLFGDTIDSLKELGTQLSGVAGE